jgi:predicted ATPase
MVFIVGEPGIGKSRLLYEFNRRLGNEADWCEGHSVSFGWSIAYHPLIDLLKRSFCIEESDSEDVIIEKIGRGVLRLGEDLKPILPYLRYLMAVDPGDPAVKTMAPQLRRAEIFDGLARLMLRAAEIRPQVVLFEDLHWMDQATEFYLRYITDRMPAGRLLLILTYRPGYINPVEERTFQSRIALGSLSSADSVKMTRSLLAVDSLPEDLQTMVVRKAEGNPFFVEEVAKSLREIGAIRRSADGFVLTKPLDDVFIPDKIQDVIQARIDRLDDAPKNTLQLASVIGRKFTHRLVDRLADNPGQTEDHMQVLKALELIYEKDIYPELAYMFKHALTQDVAYNSLLEKRRRELHRVMNSLGWLYLECGDFERSFDLNFRAAERAKKRGDPEIVANAELNLSDILILKEDSNSALEYLENVRRLANDSTTSDWMKWRYTTHLFASFGEFWLARGDLKQAQKFTDQCLDRAGRTNSRKYLVKGWRLKGEIALDRKQYTEAEAAFRKALNIAIFISNPTQLWKTHLSMGRFYGETGKQEDAQLSYRAARDVIDQIKSSLQNSDLRSNFENSTMIRKIYEDSFGADLLDEDI